MIDFDPELAARAGRRIRQFLEDDIVKDVLNRLETAAYERFKAANNDQTRLEAWADARAVDELKASLRGVVDQGDLAERENPDLQ